MSTWLLLSMGLAWGKGKKAVVPRLPVAPADRAVMLRTDEGEYYGGAALWQGFEHGWGYNHRINRIGSIVAQSAEGCPQTGNDPICQVAWKNTGASGTGPDTAGVRTYLSLLSVKNVGFASVTEELVLSGREGEPIVAEAVVEVPMDAFTASRSSHVAVLNGFDLLAIDSADKFMRFELSLGEVTVENGDARVPVKANGVFSCASPECPGTDEVDYSLQVAVLVIGGDEGALRFHRVHADTTYKWDDQTEMSAELTKTTLPVPPAARSAQRVLALSGFSVGFDRELHMLQFGVSVAGDPDADLRFKNWRPAMKKESPPASYTAYREEGTVQWGADVVALDLTAASVVPMVHDGRISWKGWGRDANSAEAEAPGQLRYGQKASWDAAAAAKHLEAAGMAALTGSGVDVVDVGETRGAFDPLVRWLNKGRQAKKLERYCPAHHATDLDVPKDVAARLEQVVRLAVLLEDLGTAALQAPPVADEDGAPLPGPERLVLGQSLGILGREFGGVLHLRPVDHGTEVFGEDWWTRDGGTLSTSLNGSLRLSGAGTFDGESLAWKGTILQSREADGPPLVAGLDGTLELTRTDAGRQLKARFVAPCGETLDVDATLRPAGACGHVDGHFAEAEIRSGGKRVVLSFDDVCDGCNSTGPDKVCFE